MNLGKRLRRLRLARGMTQKELAEPTYTHAYVSTIEAGRRQPSVAAVRHFAKKLGIKEEELVTGRAPDYVPRLELDVQQARRALSNGSVDAAEASFHRIEQEAKRSKLHRIRAKALQGKGLCAIQRNRYEEALNAYEEAEEALSAEPLTVRAEAIAGQAYCLRRMGESNYAIHILESTLETLERDGMTDPIALMRLNAALAIPYLHSGALKKARRVSKEALALADKAPASEQHADMHMQVARVFLAQGRSRDAHESLRRAEDLYKQLDLQTEIGEAHLARGIVFSRQGQLRSAR